MSVVHFLSFVGLAVAAAYLQALTGFAFALVLMGGVAMFGLMPLEHAVAAAGRLFPAAPYERE